MGPAAASMSIELAIIVGAVILILAAFLVSLYIYRKRNRPTRAPEAIGPGDPPAVLEEPHEVHSGGGRSERH
jgi:hypothetical protein